jgi:hypothetical protein
MRQQGHGHVHRIAHEAADLYGTLAVADEPDLELRQRFMVEFGAVRAGVADIFHQLHRRGGVAQDVAFGGRAGDDRGRRARGGGQAARRPSQWSMSIPAKASASTQGPHDRSHHCVFSPS